MLTTIIALIILAVFGWNQLTDRAEQAAGQAYTQPADAQEYTFRSEKYREEHFEKHGDDFDYRSSEEYEDCANKVIHNPKSLHKLEAEDGDDVYYLEETNEFVIVSTDGYIRTYFKPHDGIAYFDRQ